MNRRHFLASSSAIAAAAAFTPRRAWSLDPPASKRLRIAQIGALGKGESDCKNIAGAHDLVALVDADMARAEEGNKRYQKLLTEKKFTPQSPKLYQDFRKMFDEMAKDIDAVIVSTPDHTHYAAAVWALKHKKHVCVQKPLTNTIWEARELLRLAKEAGVKTQMGNQGRTGEGSRQAKEWIEQGAIGKLKEVRLWTDRPLWPQGVLPTKLGTPPASLNWELWQAQQTAVPYFDFGSKNKEGLMAFRSIHPFAWRGWWAYGSGALGDMGCHIMDATFNILGRRAPEAIDVECAPITELTGPMWTTLTYHLPASAAFGPVTVTWNDGKKDGKINKPERDERIPKEPFDKCGSGMQFIGSEGVIFSASQGCENPRIFPEARAADVKKSMETGTIKKTETRSPHPGDPQLEWANAIVNGTSTSSTFEYSAALTEFVLLGNLAIRGGQSLKWDSAAMRVTNASGPNRYVKREAYRDGWV